jgi:ribonuclease BN (tRNA processing enzyme)
MNGQFGSDELIVLGSGGGRYMTTSQHRSTGGIILRALAGRVQIHLDPGPGAIKDIYHAGVSPRNTTHLVLTHAHTDHWVELPVMIEALHKDLKFREKEGIFIGPRTFTERQQPDPYYYSLLAEAIGMAAGESVRVNPGFTITATRAEHRNGQCLGFIFDFRGSMTSDYGYRIGFTGDTEFFPELVHQYKGVDVLVANVLRPNDRYCPGHLCIDEFAPLLKSIHPKICVLIHFGYEFDNPHEGSQVKQQMNKLQATVGADVYVIGGEDGLHIPLHSIFHAQ